MLTDTKLMNEVKMSPIVVRKGLEPGTVQRSSSLSVLVTSIDKRSAQ